MRSARFALLLLFLLTAVPAVAACGITVPKDYIDKALRRLSSYPGLHPTIQNLAFATTYNAAAARYRGIVLSTNVGLTRNVLFNAALTSSPRPTSESLKNYYCLAARRAGSHRAVKSTVFLSASTGSPPKSEFSTSLTR